MKAPVDGLFVEYASDVRVQAMAAKCSRTELWLYALTMYFDAGIVRDFHCWCLKAVWSMLLCRCKVNNRYFALVKIPLPNGSAVGVVAWLNKLINVRRKCQMHA